MSRFLPLPTSKGGPDPQVFALCPVTKSTCCRLNNEHTGRLA